MWRHRLAALLWCALPPGSQGLGRVAVLLRGETFRVNSQQHGRARGALGVPDQKLASESQVAHVFEPLAREMGYEAVDAYLETYATREQHLLLLWYGSFLTPARATFYEGERMPGVEQGMAPALLAGGGYAAVLVVRPDLVIKPLFPCALQLADRERLLFTYALDSSPRRFYVDESRGVEFVGDVILWLPAWSFKDVSRLGMLQWLWCNHEALVLPLQHFGRERLGYVYPWGIYDSDSAKSWNPLYEMTNRTRAPGLFDPTYEATLNYTCADLRAGKPRAPTFI